MVVTIESDLEAALKEQALRQGITPEVLAANVLRERFLVAGPLDPRVDWERGLLEGARDWGCSLTDSALSSEAMYD